MLFGHEKVMEIWSERVKTCPVETLSPVIKLVYITGFISG